MKIAILGFVMILGTINEWAYGAIAANLDFSPAAQKSLESSYTCPASDLLPKSEAGFSARLTSCVYRNGKSISPRTSYQYKSVPDDKLTPLPDAHIYIYPKVSHLGRDEYRDFSVDFYYGSSEEWNDQSRSRASFSSEIYNNTKNGRGLCGVTIVQGWSAFGDSNAVGVNAFFFGISNGSHGLNVILTRHMRSSLCPAKFDGSDLEYEVGVVN